MKQLTRDLCILLYKECENEEERNDMVSALAERQNTSEMEIRQILQIEGAYVVKEGKTEKEQYAQALWSITNIPVKEWMKLTIKNQKALMEIFKGKK